MARAAGAISRAAGPVGLAIETIFGEGAAGHRPAGETATSTATRQLAYARKFQSDVNREAGREIVTGDTADEIIASIAAYRGTK